MNAQLKKKNHRSPWQARWKKIFSAATVVVFFIILSILFLSLIPCPTDLPDDTRLHRSAQISSGIGTIFNHDQLTNNSRELKSSCILIDSLKSEGSLCEIYPNEDLFQTLDAGSRRISSDKSATPRFVCRWLLHYHRNHKLN